MKIAIIDSNTVSCFVADVEEDRILDSNNDINEELVLAEMSKIFDIPFKSSECSWGVINNILIK